MLKKIIFSIICILILNNTSVCNAKDAPKPDIKPLTIIENVQNYKYGNFEKTFNKEQNAKNNRERASVLDILNIIVLSLAFIIIILFVFMKFVRINFEELLRGNFNKLKLNNHFKIKSSQKLDNGKSIYLIEVGQKSLIVGTTNKEVKLLGQLETSNLQNDDIPEEFIEKLFEGDNEDFKKLDE